MCKVHLCAHTRKFNILMMHIDFLSIGSGMWLAAASSMPNDKHCSLFILSPDVMQGQHCHHVFERICPIPLIDTPKTLQPKAETCNPAALDPTTLNLGIQPKAKRLNAQLSALKSASAVKPRCGGTQVSGRQLRSIR